MPATLKIGHVDLSEIPHRLICGTGKYSDYDVMRRALDASGCKVVTVAVPRFAAECWLRYRVLVISVLPYLVLMNRGCG